MKKRTLLICLGLVAIGPLLAATTQPAATANLLNNPTFAKTNADGTPSQWTNYAPQQAVSVDKADVPKGAPACLKIEIKASGSGLGSVSQKLRDLPPGRKLVLTGKVKGSVPGLGKFQIKLKRKGKETGRLDSGYNQTGWTDLKIDIATGEADELTVQCRFRQTAEMIGQTVRFADLKLVEAK